MSYIQNAANLISWMGSDVLVILYSDYKKRTEKKEMVSVLLFLKAAQSTSEKLILLL